MQVMTQGFTPFSGNAHFACGIVLAVAASRQLGVTFSLLRVLTMGICLISSCLIMASVIWIFSCLAFYAPAATEDIAEVIHLLFITTKPYPLGGVGGVLQIFLCSAFPIGLTAWFPSLYLLDKPVLEGRFSSLYFLLIILLMFSLLATFTFRKGLKHYAKNGSPRYTGFGHR
jgi:ABC-2 type transport system permease protein